MLREQGSSNLAQNTGQKGPVLRPRYNGPGRARTHILFYSILFYSILFYSILSILFYSILFYSILFYSILFYSILFYSFYSILSILFYSTLYFFTCLEPDYYSPSSPMPLSE